MAALSDKELDELRKLNPSGDQRMFRRFIDTIDALQARLDHTTVDLDHWKEIAKDADAVVHELEAARDAATSDALRSVTERIRSRFPISDTMESVAADLLALPPAQIQIEAKIRELRVRRVELDWALVIIVFSPTWNKHSVGELCKCEVCTYVRGNATEIRVRLAELDAEIARLERELEAVK